MVLTPSENNLGESITEEREQIQIRKKRSIGGLKLQMEAT